jgi:hypothetical protein
MCVRVEWDWKFIAKWLLSQMEIDFSLISASFSYHQNLKGYFIVLCLSVGYKWPSSSEPSNQWTFYLIKQRAKWSIKTVLWLDLFLLSCGYEFEATHKTFFSAESTRSHIMDVYQPGLDNDEICLGNENQSHDFCCSHISFHVSCIHPFPSCCTIINHSSWHDWWKKPLPTLTQLPLYVSFNSVQWTVPFRIKKHISHAGKVITHPYTRTHAIDCWYLIS